METVKLYQQDAFLQTFSAQVLRCEAQGKNWQIVLDQTAFYPEGGGQPADQGAITGANTTVRVLDVHERGAEIHHLCDGPLPVGQTVTGQVDWAAHMKLLRDAGYAGNLNLEMVYGRYPDALVGDMLAWAYRAAETLAGEFCG